MSDFASKLPRGLKTVCLLFCDVTLSIGSLFFALSTYQGNYNWVKATSNADVLFFLFGIILSTTFTLYFSGLYGIVYRRYSFANFKHIFLAVFYQSIICWTFFNLTSHFHALPIREINIYWLHSIILFILLVLIRLIILFSLFYLDKTPFVTKGGYKKILIYGAGSAGVQIRRAMLVNHKYKVLGFLDDSVNLQGRILDGIRIYDPKSLPKVVIKKNIDEVILAMPSIGESRRAEIIEAISQYGLSIKTLPRLFDIEDRKVGVSNIKDVEIDDILGRDIVKPHSDLMTIDIRDKVVLVTGGGGSIGSELCKKIIKQLPSKILVLDSSEFSLYLINQELVDIVNKLSIPTVEVIPILASVQDYKRLSEILCAWQIDTIYHAAAYKHVPLVEMNISEGVKNNIFGTLNIVKLAHEFQVKKFVLISTDKAVRSTNVMGTCKRIAEICVQAISQEYAESNTKCAIVRFGNVLGSSGSVVPLFKKQIEGGGPVTVTHRDITRYFMTISEAVNLVIQAGGIAGSSANAQVFVLDMGEPVRILDLACRMITLSGYSVRDTDNLNGDIAIEYTGLRPGEKLFEELLINEKSRKTLHPKIRIADEPFIAWKILNSLLNKILDALNSRDYVSVIQLLKEIDPNYQPATHKFADWLYMKSKD